jgi:hypothetical protein
VPSKAELDQQLESAQRSLEEEIKAADHLKAEIGRVKTIKSAKSAEIVSVSIKQSGHLSFFSGVIENLSIHSYRTGE